MNKQKDKKRNASFLSFLLSAILRLAVSILPSHSPIAGSPSLPLSLRPRVGPALVLNFFILEFLYSFAYVFIIIVVRPASQSLFSSVIVVKPALQFRYI